MKNHSSKLIHISIIACLLLMLIPWQGWYKTFQPYWLALAIIYWSIEAPKKCGLLTAFFYSINRIHKRMKMTSFWQLTLMVGALLLNDAFIRTIIDWLVHNADTFSINLWPVLTSALAWPWFQYFFDRLKQKY